MSLHNCGILADGAVIASRLCCTEIGSVEEVSSTVIISQAVLASSSVFVVKDIRGRKKLCEHDQTNQ